VGRVVTVRDDGREYSFPRLSPEGSRLAVTSPTGPNYDAWILDLRRGSLQRVTTAPGEDFEPVWHPDGTRLAISSEREDEEGPGLAWTIGPEFRLEFLLRTPGIGNWEFPTSWSPDGKWLAFTRDRAGAGSDVEILPTSGDRTPVPFGDRAASEVGAMFSPKNSFVAYVSDVSGREEVYVRPFPGLGAAIPISTNGGIEPVWNRNGEELFYREGDALKSVTLSTSGTLERGVPTTVFEGRYERAPYGGRSANYDVSLDGQRFLMVRRKNLPRPTTIHVVLNWPAALIGLRAP
jgi:Tol biopolymer transport system component